MDINDIGRYAIDLLGVGTNSILNRHRRKVLYELLSPKLIVLLRQKAYYNGEL